MAYGGKFAILDILEFLDILERIEKKVFYFRISRTSS